MNDVSDSIRTQIDSLRLDSAKPLLLCDADEVLFQFLRGLERHIESEGFHLDLVSFSLFGNIKHTDTGEAAAREQVAELLKGFFATRLHELDPVPGAADALESLSRDVEIVVLTNTPPAQREARAAALHAGGMPYPVVANEGAKGAAAGAIAAGRKTPVVFIDDIPHNIDSVLQTVSHAQGIHFVADERLRPLIPKAPNALHRVDEWPEAEPLIRAALLG